MSPAPVVSLLLTLFLISGACSLDYQEMAEDLDENTPSLEMQNVQVVTVENGKEHSRVEAGRLAEFEKTYRRIISSGIFTQYDDQGFVSAEGRADSISIDTRSDDAVLEGNIRFTSVEDKASVSADYLEWDDENRILMGSPAGEVLLEKESGTVIRGTGFSADFPSRLFRFTGTASGTYFLDESGPGGSE